jgi:hypothetical protein
MPIRAVALAGVSVVLLSACQGGSSHATAVTGTGTPASASPRTPQATDLVARAADALEQAGSLRLEGEIAAPGEDPDTVDLHLQGDDLAGTMIQGGQTIQLVATGGSAYVLAPAAWWTAHGAPSSAANRISGVWVHMPDAFEKQVTEPKSLGFLLGYLHDAAHQEYDEPVHADGPGGQAVWELRDVRDDDDGFLAVAADGTPYPVELTGTASDRSSIDYRFSEFGVGQPIVAPTGAVDLGG